jgi:hypothetical protein
LSLDEGLCVPAILAIRASLITLIAIGRLLELLEEHRRMVFSFGRRQLVGHQAGTRRRRGHFLASHSHQIYNNHCFPVAIHVEQQAAEAAVNFSLRLLDERVIRKIPTGDDQRCLCGCQTIL